MESGIEIMHIGGYVCADTIDVSHTR